MGQERLLRVHDGDAARRTSAKTEAKSRENDEFSLVLGGPLFQLLRSSRLEGNHLELLHRRLLAFILLTWVPLLLLASLGSSHAKGDWWSFVRDVEVHARFLVALPVLVAAEVLVNSRLRPIVGRFIERKIVSAEDLPNFRMAIDSAQRLRNSAFIECSLLVAVYTLGLWLWNDRAAFDSSTWYARAGGRWRLTPAGFWYVFVSIPVFQFMLLRWYLRLFIWFRFLWHVSRLRLHLVPTHPDRSAGLAFLGKSAYAFGPILFAQGAILAGIVANRVLYGGRTLLSFKFQIVGFIVFFVFAILGPLLMFTPGMARAKRKGLADYGLIAQRYVDDFEQKWVMGEHNQSEDLLGAADIQSLADLGNSYGMVREMRSVPFGLEDITRLAAATAAPLVPLLLTVFSPEELFLRVIKVLF